MTGPVKRIERTLSRLKADTRGAIAPMMALTVIPLLLGVGVAIDMARLSSSRSSLQDALDSATLAVARLPPTKPDGTPYTNADRQKIAEAWVKANLDDSNIKSLVVATPNVSTLGQVVLTATGTVSTSFSAVMGVSTLDVAGKSVVKYGTSHIELALVLDNTGSMGNSGKLDALKSAAKSLVDTLAASAEASGDPDALKIGVVPFSMTVNVGNQYQTANWITGSMPAAYGADADAVSDAHPNRFTLFKNVNRSWGGCVESRPMPYDVTDAAANSSIPASMFVPFFAPDEPDQGYYRLGSNVYYHYSNRSGQITSNNDYLPDEYPGDSADLGNSAKGSTKWLEHQSDNMSKYDQTPRTSGYDTNPVWGDAVGPNSGCRLTPILRLTKDMAAVRNKLGQMVATGDTEIPLGLVWGWHLLSPNTPFADGAAYGTKGTIKIVVLVTDGENTYGTSNNINLSNYTAYGYARQKRISSAGTAAGTASALDTRLAQLCSNMKGKNPDGTEKLIVYTVPVAVSDAGTKSLLQSCATKPENYIDVADAAGIDAAFANIAGQISALRVAQ